MMVKLNTMVAEGMAERSWADGIIRSKFEDPLPSEDNKDPFLRHNPILNLNMPFVNKIFERLITI